MLRHLLWALKQETSASQSQSQEAPDSIIISRPVLPSMSFILLGRVHNLSARGGRGVEVEVPVGFERGPADSGGRAGKVERVWTNWEGDPFHWSPKSAVLS